MIVVDVAVWGDCGVCVVRRWNRWRQELAWTLRGKLRRESAPKRPLPPCGKRCSLRKAE